MRSLQFPGKYVLFGGPFSKWISAEGRSTRSFFFYGRRVREQVQTHIWSIIKVLSPPRYSGGQQPFKKRGFHEIHTPPDNSGRLTRDPLRLTLCQSRRGKSARAHECKTPKLHHWCRFAQQAMAQWNKVKKVTKQEHATRPD